MADQDDQWEYLNKRYIEQTSDTRGEYINFFAARGWEVVSTEIKGTPPYLEFTILFKRRKKK